MHFVLLFSISVRFGVLLAIMLHCDKLAQTVWIVGLHVVSGGDGQTDGVAGKSNFAARFYDRTRCCDGILGWRRGTREWGCLQPEKKLERIPNLSKPSWIYIFIIYTCKRKSSYGWLVWCLCVRFTGGKGRVVETGAER